MKRNNDVQFIKEFMTNVGININVSQLCRVVTIEKDKKTISAQPLPLSEDGQKRAMLVNVHVGRMLRNELKVGDVVVVQFLDRSIANWDGSNREFLLDNTRTHQLNDSFVIEVY
jgi:hypothetical protein